MLVTQVALMGTIAWLGTLSPRDQLSWVVYAATLLAFLSATQDIAIDAYRRELLTNAELGRLIGLKIGAALNDDDRRLAYEAQIKALESGSPGAPMPWRNPASGRFGNIVPGPAYDRKGAQCRGYSHSVHINGQLEIARGTACRSTDGVWSAVG